MATNEFDRRSFLRLASAAAAAAAAPGLAAVRTAAARGDGSRDTPAAIKQRSPIILTGDYGYEQYEARNLPPGTVIDATRASFTVANSRNINPSSGASCEVGELPLNTYPVSIRDSPGVRFVGGLFDGKVPLRSTWRATYCNSAAILLRSNSSGPVVEGVRVRRCWDGVRFADGASDFHLRASWLSDVRDDAVENDYLYSGTIEDCLFDGCFSGISLDPASKSRDGSGQELAVDRCLIRMQAFPTERGMSHGSPFKMTDVSPRLRLSNTTVALSAENMRFRRLQRTWAKLSECHNNVLLWLPDSPLPADFPSPPEGVRIQCGRAARQQWESVRQQWIGSHAARFQEVK